MLFLRRIIRRIRSIPAPFSWICGWSAIIGIFLICASITPGWEDVETGAPVPLSVLWSQMDGGPTILVAGMISALVSYLIYTGRSVVRHAIFLVLMVCVGLASFSFEFQGISIWIRMSLSLFLLFWAFRSFYRRDAVAEYFSGRTRHRSQSMTRS